LPFSDAGVEGHDIAGLEVAVQGQGLGVMGKIDLQIGGGAAVIDLVVGLFLC
jgi:hypothetical protein